MKKKRMSPLDARWLLMESADTPMHVGSLAIFRKPRNAPEDYLSELALQMRTTRDLMPPWNYRLRHGHRLEVSPLLVEVDDIDLDYHFRHSALPSPGGERELGILVSRLHSHPLDRGRPLWECHLIEGLENERFAIYTKLHHALVEGINAIPALVGMLSHSSRRRNMPPLWAVPREDEASSVANLSSTDVIETFNKAGASTRSMGKAVSALLRQASDGLMTLNTAPRSTLNRAITGQRRFATQQYPFDRIKRLAVATDSTINDIVAYLCGSSLRRFFKEYNALPRESLVGAAPVNLSDIDAQHSGNAIAAIGISLGTHIADPLARLQAIRQSVQAAREHLNSLPTDAVDSYAMLSSMPIVASQMPVVGRFVPPLFNVGISNVAGDDKPLYFNGARLEALYPMSQLMQYSALSIACVSYAGKLNVGLTGARDTLPHLQRLAVYMGQALTDLEDIMHAVEDAG